MFKILLGTPARRFLNKCEKQLYDRVMKKIKDLAINPFPSDTKRVVGRTEKVFRIRVGSYRILYVVFYDKNEILISDIDKRPRVF